MILEHGENIDTCDCLKRIRNWLIVKIVGKKPVILNMRIDDSSDDVAWVTVYKLNDLLMQNVRTSAKVRLSPYVQESKL